MCSHPRARTARHHTPNREARGPGNTACSRPAVSRHASPRGRQDGRVISVDKQHVEAAPGASAVVSPAMREQLHHRLERPVTIVVAVLDVAIALAIIVLLILGAEWLEARPTLGRYAPHARILLLAVLSAPVAAGYARRKRRKVAQEEGIHVGPKQLPEVYGMLASHCARVGIPEPELYVSDGVEHTTSFAWRGHQCIILSTHEFSMFPGAFDEIVDFVLAREVGSICLRHTSHASELLTSLVAPLPFLRAPLNQVRTLSRDRYGAFLAPHALRALIVMVAGDRLLDRVDVESFVAQVDTTVDMGFVASMERLFNKKVPLGLRVRELRRVGILRGC